MKKIIALSILLSALTLGAHAQKYACVNTEYIFNNIPEYTQMQSQLDKQATEWQKELEAKFVEIDKMYKTYQQEAYLLPDNLKRKREDEIVNKEKDAKELQRKRFGNGGDLDKKREEMLKPLQERVYSTIERVANEKGYAFVFDKSASATVLFASAKYDISDQVLELMGYKANSNDTTTDPSGKKKPANPELNKAF
jgi:outer membrane protein